MIPGNGYGFGRSLASHGYGKALGSVVQEHYSGGYGHPGYKRRTRREIEEERRKFGLITKTIDDIAKRQVEDLHFDSQQRLEELTREFKLLELEYESKYWEILNLKREKLIDEEIKSLLLRYEDELVVMMMVA